MIVFIIIAFFDQILITAPPTVVPPVSRSAKPYVKVQPPDETEILSVEDNSLANGVHDEASNNGNQDDDPEVESPTLASDQRFQASSQSNNLLVCIFLPISTRLTFLFRLEFLQSIYSKRTSPR